MWRHLRGSGCAGLSSRLCIQQPSSTCTFRRQQASGATPSFSSSSSANCRSSPNVPVRKASSAACEFASKRTTYEGSTEIPVNSPQTTGFSRATFVAPRLRGKDELEDKYTIGKELGEGATAKVYSAVNHRTGQIVALKIIDKQLVPDEQMHRNEVGIHKATDHPNILRLLETFEDDRYLYLVTELCEGGDLVQHLRNIGSEFSVPFMPEEDALQIFQQVVASVRYLHKIGIVHRDLKPGNFLCAASSRPASAKSSWTDPSASPTSLPRVIMKLTDFGVSAQGGVKHLLTRRVGTDGYMAPEVLRCSPYNDKADIFSIGCILHTMLTGNPPKQKDDMSYKIDKMRLRYVSVEARALVEWLTQDAPEDRPSIDEIASSPAMRKRWQQLRKSSGRLGSHLLDQMHAYSSYPLLKKAALVAMVSRAESDADFLPLIEKFMSFGSHKSMNYCIGVDDLYRALHDEVLGDMERNVKTVLQGDMSFSNSGRRRRKRRRPATERFKEELLSQVEELIRKIDCDASGTISYSEWLAATVEPWWYSEPERISSTFRLFDHDADGMISEADLKKVIPATFAGVEVDAVLQESQLSGVQNSWISKEQFSLLMRTRNLSAFSLRRIAEGVQEPLLFAGQQNANISIP